MTVASLWSASGPAKRSAEVPALEIGVAIGLLILAVSPPLLLSDGVPALLLPAVGALVVFFLSPAAVPAILIASSVFQNLAIAIWVTPNSTVPEVSTARALSFVISVSFFALATLSSFGARWRYPERDARLLSLCYVTLGLVAVGAVIGMAIAGPAGAMTYARNMTLMPISLALGLICGRAGESPGLRCFTIAFVALLIFGYSELFFREAFLSAVGMDEFLLRTSERASEIQYRYFLGFSQWLRAQETVFFNDPHFAESGLRSIRLQGPTAHPISFGYALVITSLPLMARAPLTVLLLQIPIQYGVNSKGAFMLLLVCSITSLLWRALSALPRMGKWLIIGGVWGAFTGLAIILGLQHGDFHVLGFLGGINAFASNPLGHGVGTSGNLTEGGINGQIDWGDMQRAGATSRGIESAIGVLLDQLGILGLPYFGLVFYVIHLLFTGKSALHLVVATAALGLVSNGVLQEEALFSPSSAGLLFLMIGLMLAAEKTASGPNTDRAGLAPPPDRGFRAIRLDG